MRQKPTGRQSSSEQIIRDIKRKTRKQHGAEVKIRIVLDGLIRSSPKAVRIDAADSLNRGDLGSESCRNRPVGSHGRIDRSKRVRTPYAGHRSRIGCTC